MVDALRARGAKVLHGDDVFPETALDTVWLTRAGQERWVVLTKDERIRRNPLEKSALLAAKVRSFIFTLGNIPGPEMAELLAGSLVRIERVVRRERSGFIATINRTEIRVIERAP